ncbi:MAG: aminoacyl-tRNA hydrolase [Alphaproteobacteria bacterium]|nr:aminoacyl-tRNA hydrolase [Alphaproteobacteria bacterium]
MSASPPRVAIPDEELHVEFVRASGPGGQNVNKVATAVQLRFDARHSRVVSPSVFARLASLAGRRMTKDGVVVIHAVRHRTQERNRADALARLEALLAAAMVVPRERRATRPSKGSKRRRLESKRRRAQIKSARGRVGVDE